GVSSELNDPDGRRTGGGVGIDEDDGDTGTTDDTDTRGAKAPGGGGGGTACRPVTTFATNAGADPRGSGRCGLPKLVAALTPQRWARFSRSGSLGSLASAARKAPSRSVKRPAWSWISAS